MVEDDLCEFFGAFDTGFELSRRFTKTFKIQDCGVGDFTLAPGRRKLTCTTMRFTSQPACHCSRYDCVVKITPTSLGQGLLTIHTTTQESFHRYKGCWRSDRSD